MAKNPVSFRLSDEALFVIQQYQSRKNLADRTDALEGIISDYWELVNRPLTRIRHALLGDPKSKTLEAFMSA